MSDEKEKIEVGVGIKGDPPADAEITDLTAPEGDEEEVGGRYRRYNSVICPYCSTINRIIEETNYRMWFRCGRCGGAFQY